MLSCLPAENEMTTDLEDINDGMILTQVVLWNPFGGTEVSIPALSNFLRAARRHSKPENAFPEEVLRYSVSRQGPSSRKPPPW